jgi:signal transduction histidine kinase
MTASARTASWTALLAGAISHDINNFVQGASSARLLAGAPGASSADADEMAATIEADLDRMRRLGRRLRTLASAAESTTSARLDEACEDAVAEVDHGPAQLLRAEAARATPRVVGTPAALRTVIASLLEHALAASPPTTTIRVAVRAPEIGDAAAAGEATRGAVVVEIVAPDALALGAIDRERLDVALTTTFPELRGDTSLVLAGAIVDRLGGSVYIGSDAKAGLALAVHFVAAPPR